jgi:hypothetical protein
VAAPCPTTSFTRAAAARPASHGWSRISATTSSRRPGRVPAVVVVPVGFVSDHMEASTSM